MRAIALGVVLAGAVAFGSGAHVELVGGAAAQPGRGEARPESRPAAPPATRRAPPAPAERSAPAPVAEAAVPHEAPLIEEPRPETERPRAQAPIVVPRSGPGPLVAIPLADGIQVGRLGAGELPPAWSLKRFAGRAQFELIRDEGRTAFRLASQSASFALHRDIAVDLKEFPVLTWSWKVVRLPPRGDVRDRRVDDQAAQVYVVFPQSPWPRASSEVLGYVWDTHAPVGLHASNQEWANVRVIVLETGAGRAGSWVREERNVRQDYRALFGKEPPAAGRIALMTDSDHTRTTSEAFFSELAFQRSAAPSRPEGKGGN